MTKETLVAIAILNNKGSVTIDGKTIYELPTPQKSGTLRQQETYARLKAREILETIKD